MANLLFKPVEKVIDLLVEASYRQLDYIINYKGHVEDLKELIKTLKSHQKTVDEQVKLADDNANDINEDAKLWLERVKTRLEESREFDDDESLKSMTSLFGGGCSNGALPFLWHRRQLGRKAKKILAPAIEKLNNEASNYSGTISHPPDLKFGDSNPSDGNYLELESRKGIIKDIMELLKDSTVSMVGVYGRSGVGKTSLIKKIAEDGGNISKSFDKVILAIVKKDPDLQKVQQDIADGLRLTFENEGDTGRAARLRKSLKEKNVLLILDDLWDKLDLNKIGIPFADDDVSTHVTAKERKDSSRKKEGEEDVSSH
ncbi:hypothetical protein PIB30_091356, partial [Stylosanthes scabra]|nr:hypothetical protein [Stylosanthes scabra]